MAGRLARWLAALAAAACWWAAPHAGAVPLAVAPDGAAWLVREAPGSGPNGETPTGLEFCRLPAGTASCAGWQPLAGSSPAGPAALVMDGATPVVVSSHGFLGSSEIGEWRLPGGGARTLLKGDQPEYSGFGAAAWAAGGYRFVVGDLVGDIPPGASGEPVFSRVPGASNLDTSGMQIATGPGTQTTLVTPRGGAASPLVTFTQAAPGAQWSGPAGVDGIPSAEGVGDGQLAGGPSGPLFALPITRFINKGGGLHLLRYSVRVYRPAGTTLGQPVTVRRERRSRNDPGVTTAGVAEDPGGSGRVVVVWAEPYEGYVQGRPPIAGSNLEVARSSDGGRTFGRPEQVGGATGELTDLTAAMGPGGQSVVAWFNEDQLGVHDLVTRRTLRFADLIRLPSRSHCLRNGTRIAVKPPQGTTVARWFVGLSGDGHRFRQHGLRARLHVSGYAYFGYATIDAGVQLGDGRGFVASRRYRLCGKFPRAWVRRGALGA